MTPELHRPVAVERIGAGLELLVEASEAERAALALRLGVPALHALTCRFRLRLASPAGSVLAEGRLEARLDRECVLTLEPFTTVQTDSFTVRFVPEGREAEDDDPDAPDDIGYAGGVIDLGEAAAEQLALVLDPYPRSPGATLPEGDGEPEAGAFAALAGLRRSQ